MIQQKLWGFISQKDTLCTCCVIISCWINTLMWVCQFKYLRSLSANDESVFPCLKFGNLPTGIALCRDDYLRGFQSDSANVLLIVKMSRRQTKHFKGAVRKFFNLNQSLSSVRIIFNIMFISIKSLKWKGLFKVNHVIRNSNFFRPLTFPLVQTKQKPH